MIDAVSTRVIVAGGNEKRAAMLIDVARDVVIVEKLQNAAMLISVEDDQVELIDLLGKEFARRKRDQRQLIDRRAVLFLGWPQNREVHEIDGRVRLQEVAPCAL